MARAGILDGRYRSDGQHDWYSLRWDVSQELARERLVIASEPAWNGTNTEVNKRNRLSNTAGVDGLSRRSYRTDVVNFMYAPIADATLISRSTSVLAAEVDGEIVMMSIEHGRYFGLDDIGSDIWKRIETPCSFAELVDRLVADYDADRETIAADVRVLLERMAAQDAVKLA